MVPLKGNAIPICTMVLEHGQPRTTVYPCAAKPQCPEGGEEINFTPICFIVQANSIIKGAHKVAHFTLLAFVGPVNK